MNYKIEGAIRKNRNKFIICGILWLFLVIVFVVPLSYSIFLAKASGQLDFGVLIEKMMVNFTKPLQSLAKLFSEGALHQFGSTLIPFSIIYLVAFFIGFSKSMPKNEYSDIEHGSSDWSKRGEQYKVLSKNKGILLAQNNYLPLDKIGNVNVLVVGRIRIW